MDWTPKTVRWGIVAGGLILCLLGFQFVLRPTLQRFHTLDRLIPENERKLLQMRELSMQYESLKADQEREARFIRRGDKKSLVVEMEGFSQMANARERIVSMKPSTVILSDQVQEEALEVEFREVTLEQVLKVLHSIEFSQDPIGIHWIRLKSTSPLGGLHASMKVFALKER